MDSTNHWRKL